jgi:hypothetical protein
MKQLSRGLLFAIAAAAAVPATYGVAKSVEHMGRHEMTPETRARLDEGRLAMAKAALKLTPDQEKLWAPIETQARDAFKLRDTRRAEFQQMREEREKDKAGGKEASKPDMAERIDKMAQRMGERADRMKLFAGAFKPFYASLSQEQKDVLGPLMHQLAPGMGGHHGHGGPQFAEGGGWGHGGGWGGWGHRGHEGHGGHHGHGGPGGPGGEGGGGGPQGGTDRGGPQAPHFAPEGDDDDGQPVPQERL